MRTFAIAITIFALGAITPFAGAAATGGARGGGGGPRASGTPQRSGGGGFNLSNDTASRPNNGNRNQGANNGNRNQGANNGNRNQGANNGNRNQGANNGNRYQGGDPGGGFDLNRDIPGGGTSNNTVANRTGNNTVGNRHDTANNRSGNAVSANRNNVNANANNANRNKANANGNNVNVNRNNVNNVNVNRNAYGYNGRVVANPVYRGPAWGWNHGAVWAPASTYWGGGFWGAFAVGAATAVVMGSIVNAATHQTYTSYQVSQGSPGAQLLMNYQLQQVQCGPPDLVVIYGPNNGVICARPNNLVSPGTYAVNMDDLTLQSQ